MGMGALVHSALNEYLVIDIEIVIVLELAVVYAPQGVNR